MRLLLALIAACCALASAASANEAPRPFERGSWAKLVGAHAGKPTVIHFWGLTCAPCLVELPEWAKLQAARPDMKLVLLAADPVQQEPERISAALARAGLGGLESWSFADRFYERLRYEIDPAWAGELPRTVMIAADGTITVLAGVADLAQVRSWLDAQTKPRL
jgi:thiol-disulfide isomerase/thioredoxin